MIADVTHIEGTVRTKLDAVRLLELRLGRRAAITGITRFAVAGDRGNDAGFHVHLAHGVVGHIDDVEIACRVKSQLMRQIERGLQSRAAVAAVALLTRTGDGVDDAIRRDLTDALAGVFAEVESAVRAACEAKGIVNLCLGGRAAIACAAGLTGAGKGGDFPVSG